MTVPKHNPNNIDAQKTLEALGNKEWHSRDSLLHLVDHLTPEYASRKYIGQYPKDNPLYQTAIDEEYHIQIKYGKRRALNLHLNYLTRKSILVRRGGSKTREYRLNPDKFKLTLVKPMVKIVTVHVGVLPEMIKGYLEDGWQLKEIL